MTTGEASQTRQFLALFSAVMLPMFMAAVDQTLLATATPVIARELGSLSDTSWIAVGYLLAVTLMVPVYGRAGDRFGRRNVLMIAIGIFCLGSMACAAAPSMKLLIAARVLQGLGGGGLMVLSQALIGELVAPRDRPRYQGYFAIVFVASSVGGPVVGGLVVNHVSWRWLFLANLPLCLLAAWRVSTLPKPQREPGHDGPLDPAGMVLFMVAALAALLWFGMVGHRFAPASAASAALAAVALVGGVALWRQQRRRAHPFLPLDVLALPGVKPACATVGCFAATMFGLLFLLPIYLQVGLDASAAQSGLQLVPLTVALVMGSQLNGRVTHHTRRVGHTPRYGLAVCAASMAALAVLPPSTTTATVACAICGLGLGTVMPTAQLLVQLVAGRAKLGAAAALVVLTRSAGASFGTAAFGGLAFALLHIAPSSGGGGAREALLSIDPAEMRRAAQVVFGVLAGWLAFGAFVATRIPVIPLEGRETSTEPVGE